MNQEIQFFDSGKILQTRGMVRHHIRGLYFLVGCEVLTSSAGEATFPSAGDFNFDNGRCWIVEPLGMRDLSRLYFTFRDVYLKEGSQVTVSIFWDWGEGGRFRRFLYVCVCVCVCVFFE